MNTSSTKDGRFYCDGTPVANTKHLQDQSQQLNSLTSKSHDMLTSEATNTKMLTMHPKDVKHRKQPVITKNQMNDEMEGIEISRPDNDTVLATLPFSLLGLCGMSGPILRARKLMG